ncbi:MAG TPA: hypothetical protein VKV37_06410, partial [Ktedonobacteraceae bacterium]|nr:hypothetical protein [Ktedonobacteraceae bacterium]
YDADKRKYLLVPSHEYRDGHEHEWHEYAKHAKHADNPEYADDDPAATALLSWTLWQSLLTALQFALRRAVAAFADSATLIRAGGASLSGCRHGGSAAAL